MREFLQKLAAMDQAAQHKLNYEKTLALLAAMQAGQVQLEDVQLTEGGWTVSEAFIPCPVVNDAKPPEEMPAIADEPPEASEEPT